MVGVTQTAMAQQYRDRDLSNAERARQQVDEWHRQQIENYQNMVRDAQERRQRRELERRIENLEISQSPKADDWGSGPIFSYA